MNISKNYCVNPKCNHPKNNNSEKYCQNCGFSLVLAQRYKAIKPIAQGGFGKTFLAIDYLLPSHPFCVIKQLYFQNYNDENNQKIIELFEQEAQHLEELGKHSQIPNLLAHFKQEGELYLVQEYIKGTSLSEEVWQGGKEPEKRIWQILTDILPILQYIHDHQVIHRDIKPDNIMRREDDQRLVLIDFGVSRLFTQTALIGGATIIGTPEFMAPETTRGKVLPASDIYSLGVSCIRLLTQESTTDLFDIMEEKWHWREAIPSGVYITHRLGKIIDKLINPSLRDRYQYANEVLADIEPNLIQNEYKVYTTFPRKKIFTPQEKLEQIKNEVTQLTLNNNSLAKTTLSSSTGEDNLINLESLNKFLKLHNWKKADEETAELLPQLAQKYIGKYLFNSDIEKLPCQYLKIIDQLWLDYSNGHFGFSVQKHIYKEVEENYIEFCHSIGWLHYRPHNDTSNLIFKINAPKGHLPSRRWVGGYAWWRHAKILFNKLEQCGIS